MFHQLAERGLRYADELDYSVRRWVIPDRLSQASRSPATYPRRGVGLLSDLQLVIGRCLQADYDLAQPIPDRLTTLVRAFERSG